MADLFTHTTWRVKAGREEEFVAAWEEWIRWSQSAMPLSGATLLQDCDDPTRFVSFGRWESLQQVSGWRSDPEYQARVARMQDLVEQFDPQTMAQVASLG